MDDLLSEDEDLDFKECYDLIIGAVGYLIEGKKQIEPLMIAGVLTTLGLSLYKSRLDPHDFERMMETILSMTDQLNKFDVKPEKETLH